MIGLGNGRRTMKSPPLLVAALVACIIVLGFNYWIASCRSIDLQNRIIELEGRVRRAAAERGAVELKKNEFQGELQKQREQIDKIQSLHNFQMENANKIHRDEKAVLMNNITVNEKLIQNFQEHLKELQKEYGKLHLDVYHFQKNQTNLQKKFTYDMSQCIIQMKELKEQCEERLEEITRKGNEIPQSKEKNTSDKHYQVYIPVPTFAQPEFQQHDLTKQGNEPEEKQKITENSVALETPKPTPFIQNVGELDYHKDKGNDDFVTINKEEPPEEEEKHPADEDHPPVFVKPSRSNKELHPEPGIEQNPYEDIRNTLGEVVVERQNGIWTGLIRHHDTNQANTDDEEVEREQLLNDDLQQDDQEISKDGELRSKTARQGDKGTDYNLDVNEAESETDKQAALVEHQHNLNGKPSNLSVVSALF
ncbi:Golgi membrane protein 1 [Heteronotia binoei]|uniref:Golgi membrane protein 1 n=1 Tax=Heteronotia binoei TaxID=13085 RepID=UPI00292ED875|nr:Golgi membrane protein 1 [Heteronotia binoei]XP_060091423.1 Golgi membrane protein 1 [Heteronotia binoei]XP_060091424.1 Golgi membrane protein 1 [Heteronotia binoei]